ncbi:MAG: beta-phosphoglucomutase [Kiritimatiellales bacterium]
MQAMLSEDDQKRIDQLVAGMSIEEKIGQVFCMHSRKESAQELAEKVEKYSIGGVFFGYRTMQESREIMDAVSGVSRLPVIGAADLVNGAGSRLEGGTLFPWQMAVGAADSEDLAEKVGIATAKEGRNAGLHWTFGPIIDLSLNIANSMMHTRTYGDHPGHVTRLANAFIRGVQKDNLMAASAKHFPGDGVDEWDTHIRSSVNSYDEERWFKTFGAIWKSVIDSGVYTVMAGHLALPWMDDPYDWRGPRPATLSSKIQIDLLRNQLGFKGVVISDAIPMAGFVGYESFAKAVPLNIETGSDMVLWADPERDFPHMLKALGSGLLSEERLNTAAGNVLALKMKLNLFEEDVRPEVTQEDKILFERWAEEIGKSSVTVIKNANGALPITDLVPGSKVLTISCCFENDTRGYIQELETVDEELRKRGFMVDHMKNPSWDNADTFADTYDAVFVNLHIVARYGSTRLLNGTADVFWTGFWHGKKNVVFTSFGDPYKLAEIPFVPNYINCYSNTPASQREAVRVWLGESPGTGHIPTTLAGFFERTVSDGSGRKIEAVIFDLDGVLLSTDEFHYNAWKQLADREGIHFDKTINERLRGVSRMESLDIILEQADKQYSAVEKMALADSKNRSYREQLATLTAEDVYPGVPELLDLLKHKKIKIAVGSSSCNAPFILEKTGLNRHFKNAVCDGSRISRSKPDPEVFLLAAEMVGVSPEGCLVIEDADAGVQAAKAAGMKVLGVGSAAQNPNCDWCAECVADIDVSLFR